MALERIGPLNYDRFVEIIDNSVDNIVNVFEGHERGGWCNALQRYRFDGMDYLAGQEIRINFNNLLHNAGNEGDLINVSNQILDWGKMRRLNQQMQNNLQQSLVDIGNHENLNQICVERIASISKIYEMWQPNNWVIYDSYCARGLQWLVSETWNQQGNQINDHLLRFPWPPGRVGNPLDGFPRLGTENQARLGFLYASWLCRAIADQLNNNGNGEMEWKAYHIEMAAFQLGHEI